MAPLVGPIPYVPPQSTFVPGGSLPWTPQELDMMRTYMMMPKVFATPGALIEGIFSSIQGMNTDASDLGWTQFVIRQVLFNLNFIETQIAILENAPLLGTVEIEGKIVTDPQGTLFILREFEGPALINQLASRLAFMPDTNYFSPVKLMPTGSGLAYRRPLTKNWR